MFFILHYERHIFTLLAAYTAASKKQRDSFTNFNRLHGHKEVQHMGFFVVLCKNRVKILYLVLHKF